MALPVSTTWTLFDFNYTGVPEDINNILGYGEVTTSRAGIWVYIDGDGDLHIMSDDTLESSADVDVNVGKDFTFEFDFRAIHLPPDLNALNTNRCFFAVYDQQDNAAGLLLSQSGLAWVATAAGITSVSPIPGSAALVQEGTWYVIRLVVRGDDNVMYVYVTPRASLPTTGHILRYTTAALTTPGGQVDACRVEGFGTAANTTEFKLESLRLSATLNVPNQPPIAVPGTDATVTAGTYAKLDGRGSSDPEGEELTYYWRMLSAPEASEHVSSGSDGWTPFEADPDAVTDKFRLNTGFGYLTRLAAGDLLVVGDIIATIGVASFDAFGVLIDETELVLTTASLTENQSNLYWKILHQDGIGDPFASLTYGEIDATGVYVFGLTVNDGELDSMEAELVIQGADTRLVKATIPDLSYIWKCIGDEWSNVADYDKVETVWEAFSLVAAGYLYWSWQVSACSSLGTCPKKLARKWVSMGTRVAKANWGTVEYSHLYPSLIGGNISGGADVAGKTLVLNIYGGQYTVTFVGANPIPADSIVSQINSALPVALASISSGWLVLQTSEYFTVGDGTANSDLGLISGWVNALSGSAAEPRIPTAVLTGINSAVASYLNHIGDVTGDYHVVDDSTNGVTTGYPLASTSTAAQVIGLWNQFISAYDNHDANNGGGYHTTGGLHPTGLTPAPNLEAVIEDYTKFKIAFDAHAADVGEHTGVDAPDTDNVIPDQPDGTFSADDLRMIRITDVVDLESAGDLRGFLFCAFNGEEAHVSPVDRILSSGIVVIRDPLPSSGMYIWSIYPMVRLTDFDADELRVCREDLLKFSFTPDDDTSSAVIETAAIDGASGSYISFNPRPWAGRSGLIEVEEIVKKQYLPTFDETTSIPYLQEHVEGGILFRENKDYVIEEYNDHKWLRFFATPSDPPEIWWAEYVLFDAGDVIEANFGSLVGFKLEDSEGVDYLSAVKSLFYSYWQGSLVSAVKLGLQVILGLPVSETDGTIIDINTLYSETLGRILISDADGEITAYYYNRNADLATNPATGLVYAVGDSITRFSPLCTGIEVKDYLSDPHWFDPYIAQGVFREVQKYHTFSVYLDIDIVGTTWVARVVDFLDRIKEARTDYLVIPFKTVSDELDLSDYVESAVVEYLYDNFGLMESVRMFDDADGSGHWNHSFDDPTPYGGRSWAFDTVGHSGTREDPSDTVVGQFEAGDPPIQISRDLSSLNFANLNGRTLYLMVGDGRMSPTLLAAGGYNDDTPSFDIWAPPGKTCAVAAALGVSIDTVAPWASVGCLLVDAAVGSYALYQGDALNNMVDSGTIALRVRPGYSGAPVGASRWFCSSVGSFAPMINLTAVYHDNVTGNLLFDVYDSAGVLIVSTSAPFNPVAGTWYDIEASYDRINQIYRIFIDGYLRGEQTGFTGARTAVMTYMAVGSPGQPGDFAVDDLRIYSSIIHPTTLAVGLKVFDPPPAEAYTDPGLVTVVFGAVTTLQEVCDAINAAINKVSLTYVAAHPELTPAKTVTTSGGEKLIILKSWNRRLTLAGDAVSWLGLMTGDYIDNGLVDPNTLVYSGFNCTRERIVQRLVELRAAYANHAIDWPGDYDPTMGTPWYHLTEDVTNTLTAMPDPPTDANIINGVNNLKAVYNLHDANNGGVYHVGGSGHQEATPNASDLNTVAQLCNALETTFLEHIRDTTAGYHSNADWDNYVEPRGYNYMDLEYVRYDGDGTVHTIHGTPTIEAPGLFTPGYLKLTGGGNYVRYNGPGLIDDIWNAGAVEMWVKPDYSGMPLVTHTILRFQNSSVDNSNGVTLYHNAAGQLRVDFWDHTGAGIMGVLSANWAPVVGTWYHLEVDFEFVHGYQALFVDGVMLDSNTLTDTRLGGQEYLRIGEAGTSRVDIGEFSIGNRVRHWASFNPPEVAHRPVPGLKKYELCPEVYVEATQVEDFADGWAVDTDVLVVAHYNFTGAPTFDLDYVRDGGSPIGTPVGAPNIGTTGGLYYTDGAAELNGGVHKHVDYTGAGLVDAMIQTGSIEFYFIPGYAGAPAVNQRILTLTAAVASLNDAVIIEHQPGGNLVATVYDSLGVLISTVAVAWAPVAGQLYHIELDFDVTAGATRLFGDGTQIGVTHLGVGGRTGTAQLLRMGEDEVGSAAVNDFVVSEIAIRDAVLHTANFAPAWWEMKTEPWVRWDSIYSCGPVDTLHLDWALVGPQTRTKVLE